MTPWLQADIDVVARAPESDVFEKSPFLALHIRRGDKIKLHEAQMHFCEVKLCTQRMAFRVISSRQHFRTRQYISPSKIDQGSNKAVMIAVSSPVLFRRFNALVRPREDQGG